MRNIFLVIVLTMQPFSRIETNLHKIKNDGWWMEIYKYSPTQEEIDFHGNYRSCDVCNSKQATKRITIGKGRESVGKMACCANCANNEKNNFVNTDFS